MVLVLNAITLLAGVILIVGAHQRWRWLVDPPTALSPYYSQALLKKLFGVNVLRGFTYLVGLAIVGGAIAGTLVHLSGR